jgi:hypothetical protein
MKRWANMLGLSALVLLCGCGGAGYQGTTRAAAGGAGGVTSSTPSPGPNVEGNWQFSMTSTVSGALPLSIGGSISPSAGSSVSGAVHISGSNCFDPVSTVGLTGTLTGSDLSLTATSVDGQVTTLTGTISDNTLTATHLPGEFIGTYAINGGCAGGDKGNVTGVMVPSLAGNWAGDFTSETGDTNRLTVTLAQGAATSEGIFGLTGTAVFEVGTCFKSAKIVSGTFPSGSYVMGNSVSLEIETDNGVIVLLGKAKGDGLIRGNYTLAGSTCEPSGTAYLSPWEY